MEAGGGLSCSRAPDRWLQLQRCGMDAAAIMAGGEALWSAQFSLPFLLLLSSCVMMDLLGENSARFWSVPMTAVSLASFVL